MKLDVDDLALAVLIGVLVVGVGVVFGAVARALGT